MCVCFRGDIAAAATYTFDCIDTTVALQANGRHPAACVALYLANKTGNRNNSTLILPAMVLTMMAVAGAIGRIGVRENQLAQDILKREVAGGLMARLSGGRKQEGGGEAGNNKELFHVTSPEQKEQNQTVKPILQIGAEPSLGPRFI
eukprot:s1_g145.t1